MTDQHDRGWNDPPLFSLDQMSQPVAAGGVHRRNRYPQMANSAPPAMTTNTGGGGYGFDTSSAQMAATQPQSTGVSFGATAADMSMNTAANYSSQPMNTGFNVQTNANNTNGFGQMSPAAAPFDLNAFIGTVQQTIALVSSLPPELAQKWHTIQSHVYGLPVATDSQLLLTLQSLVTSLQRRDHNSARQYASYLTNHNNDTVRSVGYTIADILRYLA